MPATYARAPSHGSGSISSLTKWQPLRLIAFVEVRGWGEEPYAAPLRMIAAFTAGGVLPPFLGADPGNPADQSPYDASPLELVERFATSAHRCELLEGLFGFRAELRRLGFVSGFQWIDGSFVEEVEAVKGRPPGDIDVVTVARRPAAVLDDAAWLAFINAHLGDIFNPAWTKATYRFDAYPIDLDADPEGVASQSAYWFGLFSHQRTTLRWKGIVTIRLEDDDAVAAADLARRAAAWP